MTKKFEALADLSVPATESDDRKIRKAGGLSKMDAGDLEKIRYKQIPAGKVKKSNMPEKCWDRFVSDGIIVELDSDNDSEEE